jgi:hypothetical protein
MTITLTPQDIIVDETAGFQDADVDITAAPYSTNTTIQFLVGLDAPGGLSPREIAFKSNFVVASANAGETITSITLTQSLGGMPFSTTVGVNSGIRTVDGNYVWLFQEATHPNVVIGVIGTSDAAAQPAPSGPLAFAFGLIGTSSTAADLVTVEYVPLLHPDATNPDDRIDLTNKVFASATGTSTVSFTGQNAAPGNHDFYLINSPNDASKQLLVVGFLGAANATANVSTQGFGVNNQSINPTETLQVDFVTGGNLAAGSFSQIQYGSHLETITQAGFTINQITPSNPNLRVDITITALNVQGNEQGLNFSDGSPTTAVDITGIKLTGQSGFASTITADGTYATGSGNVTITGLSGTGNIVTITGLDNITTVDITTASPLDRLLVTGVDSNEGLDVTEFHFTTTNTNVQNAEVGSFINFDDDGPSVDPSQAAVPTLTVDETVFATDASASFAGLFTSSFGNDGFKDTDHNGIEDADALSYKLGISAPNAASGLTDTLTNESVTLSINAADTVVTGSSATGGTVFTITVNADTGEVTLDQVRAVVHDDPADPDESSSPAQLSAASLVTLTATIIDGDGDTDTATRDIGNAFKFEDDGPSIDPSQATVPTLTVDETTFATDASASFAGLFTSGAFGNDGFKDSDNNNVQDADALSYKLGISAPNAASGLTDTLTNESVTLSVNAAGTVVTGSSATGGTVFTITVNASTGEVTLDQVRAVVHDDPTDPDESSSPAQLSAASLVTLTATIIDGDGDTGTATRNIGDAFKFEDDGPSIDPSQATVPTLTVDETTFATDASASFAGLFTSGVFGNDGFKDSNNDNVQDADALSYKLGISAPNAASGLTDTLTNESVTLSVNAAGTVVTGSSATGGTVFTITVNASTGAVTLDQVRAVVHDDPTDPEESSSPAQLSNANLVTLTATIIDGDGDTNTATRNIGDAFKFEDDGPSIDPSQATVPTLTVDETVLATNTSAAFAGLFTSGAFGNDGFKDTDNDDVQDADALSYKLDISAPNAASGLTDTLTNESVTLSVNAAGTVVTGSSVTGGTVFTITVNSSTGEVTLDQARAVVHDDPTDPDESTSPAQLSAATLVTLTATIIDGDGDTDTATRDIGNAFKFEDDGPTITAAFDADPGTPGTQTPEKLGNAVGQTASGTFGYDIGADAHLAAFYAGGGSDFVDTNSNLAGVQIGLTGTVDNAQNPNITNAVVTLASESLTSASFNFSFHYDKDPITAGVQDATAGGTLAFNKVADTYTFTLNDVIDGFSFEVLHTNELLAKQPTGNTGHPLIVAEQLTPDGDPSPFFVQFTANSTTQQIGLGFNSTGDGAPSGPPTDTAFTQGAHDMVTNVNKDWVSATQSTNGVAGDTIQKGELLTLRFFQENILGDVNPGAAGGGTERLDPTTSASGIVVKFDGVGNSEDLVVILDLKDANGNEITRAVNVENSDMIKGNANVPFPYNTEFTLDNNDALLIIEQNDYTVASETYQIQGMQIMQSANGLSGMAINLNGAIGANGASSATSNLTAWDGADNDVLKIVDIGFMQSTSGTIDANLDFAFSVADADFDPTATQHILVNVSNQWIV